MSGSNPKGLPVAFASLRAGLIHFAPKDQSND
jgi:hypothetical protein